jgi:hypothetical protein
MKGTHMATDSSDNAVSGGLLVVLGIIVALAAIFFLVNYSGFKGGTDINIKADIPSSVTPGKE